VNDVLDSASQAIDEGDRSKDSNRFDEALGSYGRVAAIVAVIPDDEHPTVLQDKQNIVEMAGKKAEEAKVAKVRYEQAMADQAAVKAPAAPGAAAAPAAPK
jgi:hypothetical protein